MAKGDTLKTLVSGAQVLSDIYSKNRALDLALLQIEATQQGAAADRALKERQIELSETAQQQNMSLSRLNLLVKEQSNLREQRRKQEGVLSKTYNVNPVYQTTGSKDIAKDLKGSTESQINFVLDNINREYDLQDQLSNQMSRLQEEERIFGQESYKWAGLNKVLQPHEYEAFKKHQLSTEKFQGFSGAGFDAAYQQEMTPWRRSMLSESMSSKMIKENNDQAKAAHSAMLTATQNEDFDWEETFGEQWAPLAKEVTSSPNWRKFVADINNPKFAELKEVFKKTGFRNILSDIEGNAASVFSLEAESMGILAGQGQPGSTIAPGLPQGDLISDFDSIIALSDMVPTTTEQLFKSYDDFVTAHQITDESVQDQLFDKIEQKLGGGDLGPQYAAYRTGGGKEGGKGVGQGLGEEWSALIGSNEFATKESLSELQKIAKNVEINAQNRKGREAWNIQADNLYDNLISSGTTEMAGVFKKAFPPILFGDQRDKALKEGKIKEGISRYGFIPKGVEKDLDEQVLLAAKKIAERRTDILTGIWEVPFGGTRFASGDRSFFDAEEAGIDDTFELLNNYKAWKEHVGSPFKDKELIKLMEDNNIDTQIAKIKDESSRNIMLKEGFSKEDIDFLGTDWPADLMDPNWDNIQNDASIDTDSSQVELPIYQGYPDDRDSLYNEAKNMQSAFQDSIGQAYEDSIASLPVTKNPQGYPAARDSLDNLAKALQTAYRDSMEFSRKYDYPPTIMSLYDPQADLEESLGNLDLYGNADNWEPELFIDERGDLDWK